MIGMYERQRKVATLDHIQIQGYFHLTRQTALNIAVDAHILMSSLNIVELLFWGKNFHTVLV